MILVLQNAGTKSDYEIWTLPRMRTQRWGYLLQSCVMRHVVVMQLMHMAGFTVKIKLVGLAGCHISFFFIIQEWKSSSRQISARDKQMARKHLSRSFLFLNPPSFHKGFWAHHCYHESKAFMETWQVQKQKNLGRCLCAMVIGWMHVFLRDKIYLFRVKAKTLCHAYVGYHSFHFDETSHMHV